MKRSCLVIFLGTVAIFSGCSSGPAVDPQITASMTAHNVAPAVSNKVQNARPLDYSDILDLVQQKVPDQMIIDYLRSTQRIYNLSFARLQQLKQAGASKQVLNYLTETQGFYGVAGKPHSHSAIKGVQKDALYRDAAYQDEQPFAYNQPWVDGFYDSGYEESLSSPFSFNP
ncbi:MAG: hypothetical protein ABI615_02495 [Chthoniobacterales bacterium]